MNLRDAKTPNTLQARVWTYLAFVVGLWSAQGLLWFMTGHATPEPNLLSLMILGLVFLFWFFTPQRYWFRRGTPPQDPD
ncbi:hypothetical protein [Sinomonas albida]|uniref:hypothetical protein n=1 Tax=Sinomonas albida TaxID=369942 RepID=UPI003018C8D5